MSGTSLEIFSLHFFARQKTKWLKKLSKNSDSVSSFDFDRLFVITISENVSLKRDSKKCRKPSPNARSMFRSRLSRSDRHSEDGDQTEITSSHHHRLPNENPDDKINIIKIKIPTILVEQKSRQTRSEKWCGMFSESEKNTQHVENSVAINCQISICGYLQCPCTKTLFNVDWVQLLVSYFLEWTTALKRRQPRIEAGQMSSLLNRRPAKTITVE